ncbi:MAG: S-ribosylhomocysteine lyase [Clostridia bacterium]|nr:S-ribosylhomocysteine lyase [Clostridia bacterium]
MKKIASFTVDHDKILEGMYISRIDGDITTYDMRMRRPNMGDYIDNITLHSLEHMFATYVRNSQIGENVIYFGPMGCQTGFYLLVRDEKPERVLEITKKVLTQIIEHKGEIFGNTRTECGNYRNLNLECAQLESQRYLNVLNAKEVSFKYE